MESSQALTEALERLIGQGRVEVQENGTWLAALEGFKYELRQQPGVVLLHLWSEERNLVRRAIRIVTNEPGHLILEVSRFGRSRSGRLEFVAGSRDRQPGRIVREQFRAQFREMLGCQFADERIVSLATAADLKHSLSGNYARGTLEAHANVWAVLGVAPGESGATYDALLTFGLIWLDRVRHSNTRKPVAGLRLFFPEGAGQITAHRLQALSSSTFVELYEYAAESRRIRRVDPRDAGNIESWLAPRREMEAVLAQAAPYIDRLRRLAPGAISADVIPGTCEVVLRYRGLLFARWQDHRIFYGVREPRKLLTPAGDRELERLVRKLDKNRSPVATATGNLLYRAQPEHWLQSLILEDPTRVDAQLDPRFLYSQVPALSAGDRGIMDLIGVTRRGRLAVLELKANEDIQLVMQAVDYWLRVRWHQQQFDFARYGYFSGMALTSEAPLLFLVAPSLRFHPSGDVVLRYLSNEIQVCRVGVAESWRRGLKVVLRQTGELLNS